MLGRGEAELVAQVREKPGADRFETAGARLNQRQAVAAVRDWRGTSAS
jgi:hypothetical protein